MFDLRAIAATLDSKVLAALHGIPDSKPLENVAEAAGVDMATLRASMRRLALRVPGDNWPKLDA